MCPEHGEGFRLLWQHSCQSQFIAPACFLLAQGVLFAAAIHNSS